MADNHSAKGGSGAYTVNIENFSKRLKVFYDHWKEHKSDLWSSCNTVVIAAPKFECQRHLLKSEALEIWLFGYEFPETIFVFMKNQIHVLCRQKTANLIGTLKKAANEAVGTDIVLHVRTKDSDCSDLMDDIVQAAQTQSKPDKSVFGHIASEVDGGHLLETWTEKLSWYDIRPVDVTDGCSELFAVKDTTELMCVKKAAYLTSSVLKNFVVPKLEKVIDKEEKVSHTSLMADTEKAILYPPNVKVKLKPDDVDICYPPVFQSGGKFDLKPGVSSNEDYLCCHSASVIVCAIGSKYSSYCSNVGRTYLIDATPTQSKAYETLLKAHNAAVEKVKPGNQMCAVYQAAVAVIKRDAPELLPNLTESAGSGIGLEFRESFLDLNGFNDRKIKQGMIFNVSLGLHNINSQTTSSEKTEQCSLLLADTVLVTKTGHEILTASCSKAVKDVAYPFSKGAGRMELMKKIMNIKENIRNVCVFAPSQPNIVKALSSDPTLLAPELSNTIDREDEPMALYYRLGEGPRNTFLVNVTQCSKVSDSSMELSIVDGALLGVELSEGFTSQSESFIRQALYESVVPLLCINVPDIEDVLKSLKENVEIQAYGEQIYHRLSEVIKKANEICEKYENKVLNDVTFDPRKGNVCFCSSSLGWAFTLDDMANFWAPLLSVDHSLLLGRLWGDNFYDPGSKKWSAVHTETSTRGFVHFCIKLIVNIFDHCLQGDLEKYEALFGGNVKDKQQFVGKVGVSLYKEFIPKFLPASRTFVTMVICKLPSAQRAQQYRADHLYTGPMNDVYASAIRTCNPTGPLMVYISKTVIDAETNEPIAFGRIYSGIIRTGMEVDILGPAYEEKAVVGKSLKVDPIIWIGKRQQQVESVCSGNIIGMRGIHQIARMGCTVVLNEWSKPFPMRTMSFYHMNNMQIKDVTLDPIYNQNSVTPSNSKCFSLPYIEHSNLFFHQRQGLDWLWKLHCSNKGGILADDMGLGKSRLVSAFLRGLFHSDLIKKAIIVAPLSVIYHWQPELMKVGLQSKMFTEGNSQLHLSGLENVGQNGGVILTTYETICNHKDKISDKLGTIDYIFADEGHRIKNEKVGASKALRKIKCDRRIIVTGTPIPNNLMEFYALMKFCNPTLLGTKEDFKETYSKPIDRGKYKGSTPRAIRKATESKKALSNLVAPFILRRSKSTLKDSGRIKTNKYEVTVWIKISCHQVNLYEALICDPNPSLKELGGALKVYQVAKSLCFDPSVVGMTSAKDISQEFKDTLTNTVRTLPREVTSSKLSFLLYFLPLLLKDKHKILVFSMSRKMLKLIKEALSAITNEEIISMDGTTTCEERVKLIDKFQRKDGPPIFLLTTKVGGVGITLTAASRVIIVDPSDNPCNDYQAFDRAYRIGQERDVIIYRLFTCGTVEEDIYERQILKVETSDDVLEGKQGERKISKKKEYVLCIPPEGFDVSQTHLELVEAYGNKFESSLELERDVDLVKMHPSVFDVFNQSAICSLPKVVHSSERLKLKGKLLDMKDREVKKKKMNYQLEQSTKLDHDELQKGGNSDLPTDANNGLIEAPKMGDGQSSHVMKVYQRRKQRHG